MELIDSIKIIAQRFKASGNSIQTEEATKTSLILPFIQALGYDIFNPAEVTPEFTADIVDRKGEKIDRAPSPAGGCVGFDSSFASLKRYSIGLP